MAGGGEFFDLGVVEAKDFAVDVVVMFAEEAGGRAEVDVGFGESVGWAEPIDFGVVVGGGEAFPGVGGGEVGVFGGFFGVEDGAGGDAGVLEGVEEFVAVAGGGPRCEVLFDEVLGGDATGCGGKGGVGGPGGAAEEIDEGLPFGVASAGDGDPAVGAGGGEDAAGDVAFDGAIADGAVFAAVPGCVEGCLGEHMGGGFDLGHFDGLSLAGSSSMAQGGHDGDGAMHASPEVAGEDADVVDGGGVAVAAEDGGAGDAIDVGAIAAAFDVGAGAPEGRHVEDDDVGADGTDGVVVEAEFFECADGEVFGEDVAGGDELFDDGASFGPAAIDGEGFFVAEDLDEGGAVVPRAGAGIGRVAGDPRGHELGHHGVHPGACGAGHRVPDEGVFDFDALGAEVGEVHGGGLAGPDGGEVADADALEGEGGGHAMTPEAMRESMAAGWRPASPRMARVCSPRRGAAVRMRHGVFSKM